MATTTIKSLKVGNYVIIDGEPCKVLKINISKPGKHGAAKARVEAVGLIDNKKRQLLRPVDTNVEVPIILKKKAQVVSISGDTVQLMDLEDYSMFETTIPEELKGKLNTGNEIIYWKIGNKILLKE